MRAWVEKSSQAVRHPAQRFLVLFGIVFVLSLIMVGRATQIPQSPSSANLPKLVLVLVLDQMRYDYLPRFNDLYKGGLRRMIDQGAVFTNARYRHTVTETGPGHSVILSGRHPSNSGIIANAWWDSLLHIRLNVVDDPVQTTLGGRGRGVSPVNFIGFTVGDMLKLKNPASHVVGASFKDRSAVLPAGHRGDAAYWFEADGNFVTSTYYMPKAPDWLGKWNAERLADTYAGKKWERLLTDETIYEKYAGRDDQRGEYDNRDIVFPHVLPGTPPAPAYYAGLRNTPFADEVLLSFVLQVMKSHSLGQDEAADILAVGFSATDTVGHRYGPQSQEIMDQLLRLDRVLDELFQNIDRTVGLANTLVVATADHGVTPLAEVLQAKGVDARRLTRADADTAIRRTLQDKYPGVPLIADLFMDVGLYLDEDVIRKNNLDLHEVEETAKKAILATGWFEAAYTKADLIDRRGARDPDFQLYVNSFFAPRSANVTFMPKKEVTFSTNAAGHGTIHEDDRHVPIIFMGKGIKPGWYSEDCGPEDIAPTLGKILGLNYPKEFDARLLTEILP